MRNKFRSATLVCAAIALAALTAMSCHSTGAPEITLSTISDEIRLSLMGSGEATIRWGDGEAQTITLKERPEELNNPEAYLFVHHFSSADTKTVTITGAITGLLCFSQKISALDVGSMSTLELLQCSNNSLTTLDVAGLTQLELLDCSRNQLSTLNVGQCLALEKMICQQNDLTSLNLSGLTLLEEVESDNNRLASVDITGCTSLSWLSLRNNDMNADALETLIGTLPEAEGILRISGNPGRDELRQRGGLSTAAGKGWQL